MIEIARVVGLATVQDLGRPGLLHAGIPEGGAMCPRLLERANAAAGNAPQAAGIEAFGSLTIVARAPLVVGRDDGSAIVLDAGASATFDRPKNARVHCIAVRGGIDVPRVLGARSTLLVSGVGGLDGRPLRAGDLLAIADEPENPARRPMTFDDEEGAIRLHFGPDRDAFDDEAEGTLVSAAFTISPTSDRIGTRLRGPRIVARSVVRARPSAPMMRGAIQVPPDGDPIVLGPDHPITGGYPVIACVARADLGRFMEIPLGGSVRFTVARAR